MLLDIRLLELSEGKRGLREVFRELIFKFGETRPFDDEAFLDEFVAATYPEVADFMQAHVEEKQPLPFAEYFGYLGIEFVPNSSGTSGKFSVLEDCTKEQLDLREAWLQNL